MLNEKNPSKYDDECLNHHVILDKEFEKYRAEVIEPLNDRVFKTAEMGGRYTTMLEETEEAFHYINEELIPYAAETRDMAMDAQDGLVNP